MAEIRILGSGYYGVDTDDVTSFSSEVSAWDRAAKKEALSAISEEIKITVAVAEV
jgi:hypothetical protein